MSDGQEGRRTLLRLSAALGADRREEVRAILGGAARELAARRVEETLLQAYLFVGFPPVLEAFRTWREEGPSRAESRGDLRDPERILEDGRATCRRVYGGAYGRLRSNVAGLHAELDRWMVEEGYGKVLSRPGLDLATRELCIVALLAAAGWPRQLHSHLRGALRVGAGEEAVGRALEAGLDAVSHTAEGGRPPPEWERRVRELWRRVRHRQAGEQESTTS